MHGSLQSSRQKFRSSSFPSTLYCSPTLNYLPSSPTWLPVGSVCSQHWYIEFLCWWCLNIGLRNESIMYCSEANQGSPWRASSSSCVSYQQMSKKKALQNSGMKAAPLVLLCEPDTVSKVQMSLCFSVLPRICTVLQDRVSKKMSPAPLWHKSVSTQQEDQELGENNVHHQQAGTSIFLLHPETCRHRRKSQLSAQEVLYWWRHAGSSIQLTNQWCLKHDQQTPHSAWEQ